MKDPITDNERLFQQGVGLTKLSEEILLETIGLQLLTIDRPGRAVGIVTYLSSSSMIGQTAKNVFLEPSEALIPLYSDGISEILTQCRERAKEYLKSTEARLISVLCEDGKPKKEIIQVLDSEGISKELIKIMADLVVTTLGLPPLLTSLSITIAAWVCKNGVEKLCASSDMVD